MRHTILSLIALLWGASAPLAVSAATIYPSNDGFEVNDLGGGGGAYEYNTVPSWTTSGNPGEAANGSGFGVSGATNGNHDGTTSTAGQAALFQGGDGTLGGVAITQSVTLPAGVATINFLAEERACCGGNNGEAISVYLDGALLNTFTPGTGSFTAETSNPVVVSAGPHVLGFAGQAGTGDTTAFIDSVSVTVVPVPEPASLALFGLGAIGLFAADRRRRAA